jgi:hypothetical protein
MAESHDEDPIEHRGRARDFDDKLVALMQDYSDVPHGARGFTLFISFLGMAAAEKGSPINVQDVAALSARFTKRCVKAGIVLPVNKKERNETNQSG